jgi:tRNA threonylcarbamoyladenosine biosynthesis protein TsaE
VKDAGLAEPDPAWAELFSVEAERIAEALGERLVEIEHVGSTSVPGLASKPTVDVAAGATTLELPPDAVRRLADLGYEDAGADSRPGERRFRKGESFPRQVILHVVEWGGPMWRDFLAFRDELRSEPTLAREYAELKRSLLAELGDWYRGEHKDAFIQAVLARGARHVSLRSSSPEETEGIGAALAAELAPGDVVTVAGELGAGKTTLVRGACRALGVAGPVTSPTYTIGHRYEGRVRVSHLDLYRFEGLSAAEWGDLEPYFDDAVVFVEWPEAAGPALPSPRAATRLRHDGSARMIALESEEKSLLDRVFRRARPCS